MTPDTYIELAAAAEDLARLLEAATKKKQGGLRHPRHAKTLRPVRKKMESILRQYFDRQKRFLVAALSPRIRFALATHPPQREADVKPKSRLFADDLIPTSFAPLTFPATSSESFEFASLLATAIAGAAQAAQKEFETEADISGTASAAWLRDNSFGKLTEELSAETGEQLRASVAAAWEAGGSHDQIVGALKQTFDDFSDYRIGMIAQTEANDAYIFGRDEIAREAGYDEKSWDPDGDACEEICQPNVDDGWIGIDETFSSGDDEPTAHPNCDCGLNYRRSTIT